MANQSAIKSVKVTKALGAATVYHAEDVISEHTTTGTVYTFSAIGKVDGGSGYIVGARVNSETTSVTPRLTWYLFNAAPSTNKNDHAANTAPTNADLGFYIGSIDFPALEDLGGTSAAFCTPSTVGGLPLPFTCATNADDLLGILVTKDAFTQTAGDDMTVTLTVEV